MEIHREWDNHLLLFLDRWCVKNSVYSYELSMNKEQLSGWLTDSERLADSYRKTDWHNKLMSQTDWLTMTVIQVMIDFLRLGNWETDSDSVTENDWLSDDGWLT